MEPEDGSRLRAREDARAKMGDRMASSPLQLRNPIVLVHGLGATDKIGPVDYFGKIPEYMRAEGNTVRVASMTAFHRIEERARQLKEQIEKTFPDSRVNLIAHSMGGLDARYAASRLGIEDRIASVTTIGTPNRGTSICDLVINAVPSAGVDLLEKFLQRMNQSAEAYKQLTSVYIRDIFGADVPNAPGVGYFSATTVIRKPIMKNSLPLFWFTHRYLKSREGENDGFVSEESAKWGEHIVTGTGDHYAQIAQPFGMNRGGIEVREFYHSILRKLAERGM